jgi:hypothetical protein
VLEKAPPSTADVALSTTLEGGLRQNFVNRKEILPRSIILFANIDVSRHILVINTSILAKSNMGWREYSSNIEMP